MTSVCAKCHIILGEKCQCGSTALFRRVAPDNRVMVTCSGNTGKNCPVKEFATGESGATHTVCEPCGKVLQYPDIGEEVPIDSFVAKCVSAGYTLPELTRLIRVRFAKAAMRVNRDNQTRAAREIGVHRNTLARTLDIPDREPLRIKPKAVRAHDQAKSSGGAA
jgi:hypothetical protein